MNRQRFLAELTQLLAFMTPHDRAATIRELTERFDEAGIQGEGVIIASLGTPTAMAIRLAREYVPTPAPAAEPEPVEAEDKPIQPETVSPDESGDEQASAESAEADTVPVAENAEPASEAEPENISEENSTNTDPEAPEAVEESENEESEEKTDNSESDTGTPETKKTEVADTLIEDVPPDEKIPLGSVPEAQRVLSPEISALFGIDSSPKIEPDDDDDGERKPNGRAALNLLTVCGGLVLLCVTLIMCAVLFAPGAAFGGAAFLSVIAGIWAAPVFADALYLYGIAVMALALTLLFLFLAVWAIVAMVKPLIQDIRWLYKLTGGERE